jgi:2-oxoglutarate ferredoxin oxidoreductase subunit alpha
MSMSKPIVIRITGDSGDGIQLVGERLTLTAAISGKDVRTLPDFPAEIRAPLGSIAGVSAFQLAISEHAIFTAGEEIDVLAALNPAALKKSLEYLQVGSLLILNEDNFKDIKDLDKLGFKENWLQELESQYQVINLPIITNTIKAVSDLNISHSEAKKSKNFYLLGVILWLFDLSLDVSENFIQNKFIKNKLAAEANILALHAGYNYALTLEIAKRQSYLLGSIERQPGQYRQITGVEGVALALATIATKLKKEIFVAGYPITPASAILESCAKLYDYGIKLFQAEDEISAACACLGAAFSGSLALTCTSGPGLDLKSETIGLAVVSELPMVILNVSRAGPSTGLPTKTGQSDLQEALYGRHGESPLIILSAKSPGDCFTTIIEAFCLAVKFMTPVIVLLDAYLAIAAEPWNIPDPDSLKLPDLNQQNLFKEPFKRDDNFSHSWNVPGTPGYIYQVGGLEKHGAYGKVSYDANNHQQMVNIRAAKISKASKFYSPINLEGDVNAKTLVISWGSTYGCLRATMQECFKNGYKFAYLHLRNLNPLPQELFDIIKSYETVLVAELNTGQLIKEIRSKFLVDAKLISQCNGQPFSVNFLVSSIKEWVTYAEF